MQHSSQMIPVINYMIYVLYINQTNASLSTGSPCLDKISGLHMVESSFYLLDSDTMWLEKAAGTNSNGAAAATVQIQTEG